MMPYLSPAANEKEEELQQPAQQSRKDDIDDIDGLVLDATVDYGGYVSNEEVDKVNHTSFRIKSFYYHSCSVIVSHFVTLLTLSYHLSLSQTV